MITAGHIRCNERSKRLVKHSEYDSASFFSSYSLSKALENSPRFSPWSRYDSRNDFVGSFASDSDSDEKGACVTDESRFFGSRFGCFALRTFQNYVYERGAFTVRTLARTSYVVLSKFVCNFHLLSTFFSSAFAFTNSSRKIFKVIDVSNTRFSFRSKRRRPSYSRA